MMMVGGMEEARSYVVDDFSFSFSFFLPLSLRVLSFSFF